MNGDSARILYAIQSNLTLKTKSKTTFYDPDGRQWQRISNHRKCLRSFDAIEQNIGMHAILTNLQKLI